MFNQLNYVIISCYYNVEVSVHDLDISEPIACKTEKCCVAASSSLFGGRMRVDSLKHHQIFLLRDACDDSDTDARA